MNKIIFKKSFIRQFYKKKLINLFMGLVRLVNNLIPKNNNIIVAFIDYEKVNTNLVPYKTDNVYILSKYIIQKRPNVNIVYIPSNQFGGKDGYKISLSKKLYFLYIRFRASLFLYKQPPHLSSFFTKKQFIFCLGYFPMPFKADYWDLSKWWVFYDHIFNKDVDIDKEAPKYKSQILEHFTYTHSQFSTTNLKYVVSSNYAGEIISRSHNIPLDAFITLGSIKNDIQSNIVNFNTVFNTQRKFKKIILYTPTFRDNLIRKNLSDANEIDKTIFGYIDEKNELEDFLIDNEVLLIVKLHKSFPYYRQLEEILRKSDNSYFKNCYFLDFELENKYNISVYDLFSQSDAMIADYSSISFDYLHYDKPIIYNIPDIDEYRKYRGFSHEPIEDMMAGPQVKTIKELKNAISDIINGNDSFSVSRKALYLKINEKIGEDSTENIYNYLEKNIF